MGLGIDSRQFHVGSQSFAGSICYRLNITLKVKALEEAEILPVEHVQPKIDLSLFGKALY